MKITVHLQSILRKGRFESSDIYAPDGGTASDLIDLLDISRDRVGIIVVNRADATFDHPLADGDTLTLYPPLGGG